MSESLKVVRFDLNKMKFNGFIYRVIILSTTIIIGPRKNKKKYYYKTQFVSCQNTIAILFVSIKSVINGENIKKDYYVIKWMNKKTSKKLFRVLLLLRQRNCILIVAISFFLWNGEKRSIDFIRSLSMGMEGFSDCSWLIAWKLTIWRIYFGHKVWCWFWGRFCWGLQIRLD